MRHFLRRVRKNVSRSLNWAFGGKAKVFTWALDGETWTLTPSPVTVSPSTTGSWDIYIGERRLMPGNFSNVEGAKRVAWQFAEQNKGHLGASRIALSA